MIEPKKRREEKKTYNSKRISFSWQKLARRADCEKGSTSEKQKQKHRQIIHDPNDVDPQDREKKKNIRKENDIEILFTWNVKASASETERQTHSIPFNKCVCIYEKFIPHEN